MTYPRAVPAKKATATRKAAAPKAEVVPKVKAIYADIPVDVRKKLSEDIMNYQDPNICPAGRMAFLHSIGFPVPPRRFNGSINISMAFETKDTSVNNYGERLVKQAVVAEWQTKIKEALEPLGLVVNQASFGYVRDRD